MYMDFSHADPIHSTNRYQAPPATLGLTYLQSPLAVSHADEPFPEAVIQG